ncbi:hypothetical protein PAXRUDRAFT_101797, partial [Paxillus rubicundulus Ve08.2h10]
QIRETYYVIDHLAHASIFAYSEKLGANVGVKNQSVWDDHIKKHKDANTFQNKGWPFYEKMKNVMPSKARGAN